MSSESGTVQGCALFFGPHPDDIELFAGGTAARLARLGHRVVLCDLTRGEQASNGTPEQRAREARAAAEILGAAARLNLGIPDTGVLADDRAQALQLAQVIRDVRPNVVFAPWTQGRHPDHEATAALVRKAVFFAGLARAALQGERHAVSNVLHYLMRFEVTPTLLVPLTSEDQEAKVRAIAAHGSQVGGNLANPTLVGQSDFMSALQARDRHWGAHAGVPAAEAFVSARLPVDDDPVRWAQEHPAGAVHWFREPGA